MGQALDVHRLHFAFTVTFHYIFPQLTMGLALLLVYLKTKALRTGDEHYDRAARFWARIFGINFALGVVTGIPMEFQFGTNWAAFSKAAGGVIGQVNESDYSGNADTGSNFRIGSCQYVYNLNARALGAGTYRVDILINGQVVGSATFGLN